MSNYKKTFLEESAYLQETIDLVKYKLELETNELQNKKTALIASRKDMWENTTHSSTDFDKLSDANQYLSSLQSQTLSYTDTANRVSKYEKILVVPYFSRIDFTEEGYDDTEKIYIGLFNLMDEEFHTIKVYDWRAPISSLFYRYEPGVVEYIAPSGKINGSVSLKRQYKIKNSTLEYYFDSNVNILDDMLKDALSKNMSSKMKTIVETIQRQQDLIIRDLVNEILVVQGVAGSGKTSVALHRIAFLLYQGLNLKLNSNNIVIISPNNLFSKYISNVLPELGEENIDEITFENIFHKMFKENLSMKTKSEQLEEIISSDCEKEKDFLRSIIQFKGSSTFLTILDRFIQYFEHKMIDFEDIYFNGKHIESRHLIKALLLSNKLNMPTAKKLAIIENRILDKINDSKKSRREKIESVVNKSNRHQFESKSFTRVLSAKESSKFRDNLNKMTKFNCIDLYKKLFEDKAIFFKLSKNLELPENINEIIDYTNKNLDKQYNLNYSDGIGLLYLKIKTEGIDLFSTIKQVIVDEAQDYQTIHFKILKLLFKQARFTLVGDINQSIERNTNLSIYDEIISIFDKQKSSKIKLSKSYRCSYEIGKFSQKFLDINLDEDADFFKRNEGEPEILYSIDENQLENKMIDDINSYTIQGFESIAIVCKSKKQATQLYLRLKSKINVKLVDSVDNEPTLGTIIIPVYMAKGLEFDVVMVYGVDNVNYKSDFDKRLLYIACTRPLHKLSLYYTNEISSFLL